MSVSDIIPLWTIILWREKDPIPNGWIPTNDYIDIDNIDDNKIIAIQKVDNLTWIEHLAKERHLV